MNNYRLSVLKKKQSWYELDTDEESLGFNTQELHHAYTVADKGVQSRCWVCKSESLIADNSK